MQIEDDIEELTDGIEREGKRKEVISVKYNEIAPYEDQHFIPNAFHPTNGTKLMLDSLLSVHVIDARSLPVQNSNDECKVFLSIEGQFSRSRGERGSEPIWNEMLSFDIRKATEPLVVQVKTGRANNWKEIGEVTINLEMLSEDKEQIDQVKQDRLYQLYPNGG